MSPELQSALLNWEIPPITTLLLLLAAIVYVRGWLFIGRTRPDQFPEWRLGCYLGGLLALFLAIASPVDTLDETLLSAHMIQHFLFMSAAPPLLLLGSPQVPLLRGLPRVFVRHVLGPFLRMHRLRMLGQFLTKLRPAWFLMNLAYIGWHVPAAYELALRSENWHSVEHLCFLLTSVLFWWPVVCPWPSIPKTSRLLTVPYLLCADLVNTGVSAFLCFSGRLLYPSYANAHRPIPISALNDQVAAGAFMWVFGSLIFLIPVVVIFAHVSSSQRAGVLNTPAKLSEF